MFVAPLLIAGVMMTSKPVLKVEGDWTVKIPAQSFKVGRSKVKISEDYVLALDPPRTVVVKDEKHDTIPVFNPNGTWRSGAQCMQTVSYGITIAGIMMPETFNVKKSPGGEPFVAGKDYGVDLMWANVGRLDGGDIHENTSVYLDYSFKTTRVDTVAVDNKGVPYIIKGNEAPLCSSIPVVPSGSRRLANVFVAGYVSKLTDALIYPIDVSGTFHDRSHASKVRACIPKTWEKLVGGEHVTILAWGDSVTDAAYLPNPEDHWQNMFVKELRRAFPLAKIDLITEAWGGRTTSTYLAQPPGNEKNFKEKVVDLKPDLVISEFVNDAGIPEAGNRKAYDTIKAQFNENGIEWIAMTPHYDTWQYLPTFADRVEKDVRPYVQWLREYTAENGIGLADASERWDHLAERGVPYAIYLTNGINHPNKEGLKLYADALMDAFH